MCFIEEYCSSERSLQSKLKSQTLSLSINSLVSESQIIYDEHFSTSFLHTA